MCNIDDQIREAMKRHENDRSLDELTKVTLDELRHTNMYRDGESCSHPGCASHISHPCEKCDRKGARHDL